MFRTFVIIAGLVFPALVYAETDIQWGISEVELLRSIDAKKVSDGTSHGHGFSDFTEVNPVVYVSETMPDKKLEFYFHEDKLYKIYVIYRNQKNAEEFYKSKISELEGHRGKPSKVFSDELFSMPIIHHVWETESESFDLRFGAGYVYEVRTDKAIAKEKQQKIDLQHAI